ncbi:hypothetical protein AQJ23_34925 [Streptomyces antibioticus]|nr:hypothetical protein AQJ23_34925 [Streptomyces antibioticus]
MTSVHKVGPELGDRVIEPFNKVSQVRILPGKTMPQPIELRVSWSGRPVARIGPIALRADLASSKALSPDRRLVMNAAEVQVAAGNGYHLYLLSLQPDIDRWVTIRVQDTPQASRRR